MGLYPALDTEESAVGIASGAYTYRLQQISVIKKQLEDDRDIRAALYKKYRRGVNAIDGVDTTLLVAGMSLGVSGIGLLSTIIAAPIALGLESAALVCGLLNIGGKYISRRLSVKAKKHNDIRLLAEAKLNTISDLVSTALVDGKITEVEFQLIYNELEKYQKMRQEIRVGARKTHNDIQMDDKAKKELLKEARASLIQKLSI